jgi:hypothetical protein
MTVLAGCTIRVDDGNNCTPGCDAGATCSSSQCIPNSLLGRDAGHGNGGADGGGTSTGRDAGPVTIGDGGCGGTSSKAQMMPLDIFIMLDQSGSMSSNGKWDSVTSALSSFLQSSQVGVEVGLQYFGLPCTTQDTGSLCGSFSGKRDSCNRADYAQADVDIAALPGVATAINASINSHSPSTATPTSAALQGAIDYATTWAKAHTDHVVIVILATDGEPTECDTNISNIKAIAASGASGSPKILTFVIGIDDGTGNVANLNAIAAGGGSDVKSDVCPPSPNPCKNNQCNCDPGGANYAFMVSTSGNVNAGFLAALNAIRGAALGCNYYISTTGTPDYSLVNVEYHPGDKSAAQMFGQVTDASKCTSGSTKAWYYDNATSPTQIILCPATCNIVEADTTGEVDVVLGCTTITTIN